MEAKVAVLKRLPGGVGMGIVGPFGAEGPVIMTGGAAASLLAQACHLTSAERKALLVAGACAGMTAVFGTPLAAILLAAAGSAGVHGGRLPAPAVGRGRAAVRDADAARGHHRAAVLRGRRSGLRGAEIGRAACRDRVSTFG